ncbi:hypothetical protein D3C78_1711470 [compost metagenome]
MAPQLAPLVVRPAWYPVSAPEQVQQESEAYQGAGEAEAEADPPGPEVDAAADGAAEGQQPGQQGPPQITGHMRDPLVMMEQCPEG